MFERAMLFLFAAAVAVQLALGFHRARLLQSSIRPALALAALYALIGLLWYARRKGLPGAALARPAALFFATIGVVAGLSAINAPFLGFFAAFSVPMLMLSSAALLMVAELSPKAHILPLIVFVVAVTGLEAELTAEARWESRIPSVLNR